MSVLEQSLIVSGAKPFPAVLKIIGDNPSGDN